MNSHHQRVGVSRATNRLIDLIISLLYHMIYRGIKGKLSLRALHERMIHFCFTKTNIRVFYLADGDCHLRSKKSWGSGGLLPSVFFFYIRLQQGQSIEAEFTVLPSIALDATSATAGSILSVSGLGFSAGSNINVYFRNDEVAYSKTDESGSFDKTLFNVPEIGPGTYEVTAVDKAGNRGSTTFTINAETITETVDEVTVEDVTDEAGSPWYIYTLIGIGVLIIGILFFWLRRRNT